MSARSLIIEDETEVAHAIERGLAASGFDVVVAAAALLLAERVAAAPESGPRA